MVSLGTSWVFTLFSWIRLILAYRRKRFSRTILTIDTKRTKKLSTIFSSYGLKTYVDEHGKNETSRKRHEDVQQKVS